MAHNIMAAVSSEPSSAASSSQAIGLSANLTMPADGKSAIADFLACNTAEDAQCELPRRIVNLIVLDYLVKQGFATAAKSFIKEAGLEGVEAHANGLLDDYAEERVQIRNLIVRGEIMKAVELIKEYFPTFLDDCPAIHMDLLHLVLVELISNGKSDDALTFAQDIVAKQHNIEELGGMDRYERTMALLAYEKPEESPFRDMLDEDLRRTAAVKVSNALYEQQGSDPLDAISRTMKLSAYMQAQLAKASNPKVSFPENYRLCDWYASNERRRYRQPLK